MDWLYDSLVDWLTKQILKGLKNLWSLLSQTAFTAPDITTLPQVATISSRSLTIVNIAFVLAIITAGVVVMTRETVQVRYGVAELAPRLVVGFVAANQQPAALRLSLDSRSGN